MYIEEKYHSRLYIYTYTYFAVIIDDFPHSRLDNHILAVVCPRLCLRPRSDMVSQTYIELSEGRTLSNQSRRCESEALVFDFYILRERNQAKGH